MKILLSVLTSVLLLSTSANASVVKKVQIGGEEYSCRPSKIESPCTFATDMGAMMMIAGAAAEAHVCLDTAGKDASKIRQCFLQERLKRVSRDLDVQMVGASCWKAFVSKCTEIQPCPDDRRRLCGYLGSFLQTLKDNGNEALFTNADGLSICDSLTK